MTQLLTKIIADFSTTLTTKTAIGATTATLTSGLDGDGIQLPTATYGFTIDRNNANKEYFTATLTGANLTAIKTVTRGTGVGTSGLVKTHRKGAEVIISDWVAMKRMLDILDGTTTLDSSTPLGYDGTTTISTANQLATKAYADGLAIAGSPDSSTTVKGIGKLSTAPVSGTNPIFVGDNDTRVPTQGENDALVGESGTTPSSTNKFMDAQSVVGIVSPYAGSSAPIGWLLCDGSSVLRAGTYARLFAVISTTFGTVDGTHFNLPDLRSRLPLGVGTGTKVATFASRSSNVITVTGLTNAANNEFQTGEAVLYSAPSGAMTGLVHNTTYYVIRTGNLTFSLTNTLANAISNSPLTLTSDGTGVQTFTKTFTARTLGDTGGEENHALVTAEIPAHIHSMSPNSGTYAGGSGNLPSSTGGAGGFDTGSTGGSTSHNIVNPFLALNYIIKY